MTQIQEMHARVQTLLASRNTLESMAKKISAEFNGAAYVSKGKLWVSYTNEQGKPAAQALT